MAPHAEAATQIEEVDLTPLGAERRRAAGAALRSVCVQARNPNPNPTLTLPPCVCFPPLPHAPRRGKTPRVAAVYVGPRALHPKP